MSEPIYDPENYEAMCEPYAGTESATAAMEAFAAEVGELRKKHRISDVALVYEVRVMVGDNRQLLRGQGHYGDSLRAASLYLHGAQNEHKRLTTAFLAAVSEKEDA
jgi:hypothetical protein